MKKIILGALIFISIGLSAQPAADLYVGPPTFHGAKVVGNYPNTEFLFTLPATGERPIEFSAENLPQGLTLDRKTGFITGTVKEAGEYTVNVRAMNRRGNVTEDIKIVIGDKLCLTPPLGWNSWNVFTSGVSEKLLMEIADAMVNNGMRDLGYQYINIDDFWHASAREEDGRPRVDSAKFPHGMKYLSDYMHDLRQMLRWL
jgi:alpha-galactosidase